MEVRDFPRNGERVTGVEPATLCLASTRSSQLSYTRKSEDVLVSPRILGVNQWPKVVHSTQGVREGCPYFVPYGYAVRGVTVGVSGKLATYADVRRMAARVWSLSGIE